jgi:hypothetical protein
MCVPSHVYLFNQHHKRYIKHGTKDRQTQTKSVCIERERESTQSVAILQGSSIKVVVFVHRLYAALTYNV